MKKHSKIQTCRYIQALDNTPTRLSSLNGPSFDTPKLLSSLVISIAFFALSVPLLTKTPTSAYLNTTAPLMLSSRNQLYARSFAIQDFYDTQFAKYQSDFISQDFSHHQLCLLEC
ncbi:MULTISPECIES: hypothetical protein [unclassified Photorhabdus]|uniref:hypothetical protein n=1 Tax=unclassified Photorhabdus TaxID=2620880 RepID=UPI0011BD8231|nr:MULTISPECIES: hypothetical protein [unclassified Photorhabdus]